MAVHVRFETGRAVERKTVPEMRSHAGCATLSSPKEAPEARAAASPAKHRMRRRMTREQGQALEAIGHAVDYLNDSYLYEGDDSEIINAAGPKSQALEILIASHREILNSIPLVEPRHLRIWNSLFHRKSRLQSGPVVT